MIILQNIFTIIRITYLIFKYTFITQTQTLLYHQYTHPLQVKYTHSMKNKNLDIFSASDAVLE